MDRMNVLAKVNEHEVCTGYSHEYYYTDGVKTIVVDTPRDAILQAPVSIRPLLMAQWLDSLGLSTGGVYDGIL